MAIANRIMTTQNQITQHRRNNPIALSPIQQELISALSKKEELLFLLANRPSEAQVLAQLTQVEEKLSTARHEKAVLLERIRLRAAAKAEQTTKPSPTKTATEFVAPAGMSAVEAAILKFTLGEMA